MKRLRALLALGYPFVVLAGLRWWEPRQLALLVGALLLLRAVLGWRQLTRQALVRLAAPALLVVAVLLPTLFWNDPLLLLFVPVAMNLALLVAFGRTLWRGPPLVETLARLQVPDLPADECRYCRSVTWVWCAFFAANAVACAALALVGDLHVWALYTGLLAYLLVGFVYAIEFVVRSKRFGRYQGTVVEPLFQRLFPQPQRRPESAP